MDAERISSRKNKYIAHLRALASDADYRYACAEYLCDGIKLLAEALDKGARVQSVLWKDAAEELPGLDGAKQYIAPAELFDYASPMKNSPGPVFTLAMPEGHKVEMRRAVLLENVQDPGNVGTVIRTAAALGFDTVILCGACADVYSPKTARATMGAHFPGKYRPYGYSRRRGIYPQPRHEALRRGALRARGGYPHGGAQRCCRRHRQRGQGTERGASEPVRRGAYHPHDAGQRILQRCDSRGNSHVGDREIN